MKPNKKRTERFLKFVKNPSTVKKILLIRNGMIGDMTSITTVLNRLRKTYPDVSIDIIAGPKSRTLFDQFPGINEIFYFAYSHSFLSVLKQILFFTGLSRKKYDIVIVNELDTHFTLMSRLVNGKFCIGFENRLAYIYDYSVQRPKKVMALAETEIVRAWTPGIETDESSLFLSEDEIKTVEDMLFSFGIKKQGFVILHPGSNLRNSDRQWDTEKWTELSRKIQDNYGLPIVFTGIQEDKTLIEAIIANGGIKGLCLAGRTSLRELMALCSLSELVIAPDTGIIHIAAALKTPAIMLMGLSDPEDTGPYSPDGTARICRTSLSCQPCVAKDPRPRQWEICQSVRPVECMRQLKAETVFETVKEMLHGK